MMKRNNKNKKVVKQLKEILEDEKEAPKEYMKLRKNLKNSSDKKKITKIIKQEKKHYQTNKKILNRLLKKHK